MRAGERLLYSPPMTTNLHFCPACKDDLGVPTGQLGMYRDGSPIICWTCDGTGEAPFEAVEAAIREYRERNGFSIWEHDGDTWDDNSPEAIAIRTAYWRAREQTV